jgi:hypothetical protein
VIMVDQKSGEDVAIVEGMDDADLDLADRLFVVSHIFQ